MTMNDYVTLEEMKPENLCRADLCGGEREPGSELCSMHKLYAELRADARALWSVRVLDAWALANSCDSFKTHSYQDGTEWHCVSAYKYQRFVSTSPDAARHAAALAVLPTLPADVRSQLGECP
jgi:hypothetical protein